MGAQFGPNLQRYHVFLREIAKADAGVETLLDDVGEQLDTHLQLDIGIGIEKSRGAAVAQSCSRRAPH